MLELCERAGRAKEEFAGRISEIEDRVRSLRERLPERRERLRGLRKAHADSALCPARDNAEEAMGILTHVEKGLIKARTCMAPDVRHYLAGAELLDRAVQQLDAVDALFQEVETRAENLALARQETETTLTAMARTLAEASGGLMEHEHRPLEKQLSELHGAAAVKRPSWPTLRLEAAMQAEKIPAALGLGRDGGTRSRRLTDSWR